MSTSRSPGRKPVTNSSGKKKSTTTNARSLADALRAEMVVEPVPPKPDSLLGQDGTTAASTQPPPVASTKEKEHSKKRRKKKGTDANETVPPSGDESRSRSGSTAEGAASTSGSATLGSSASSITLGATPVKAFNPGLIKRPMLMNNPMGPASSDPTRWIYLETPPAQLTFDPAQPFTIITLVTYPRRRHQFKINTHVTVRQIYQHVKYLTGVSEAFDLLYSYPHRILNIPDATLSDLGFENVSLQQRLFSEIPPPSSIGKAHREHQQQQAEASPRHRKRMTNTSMATLEKPTG